MKSKNRLKSYRDQQYVDPYINGRKPGAWAGKVIIEKDFDALPLNFLKYFK